MTGFWGSQTDQVRRLGSSMTSDASRIGDLLSALDPLVLQEGSWTGPDADAFRDTYMNSVSPRIRSAASALSALAATLAAEADQQDTASSTDGADHGGGPLGTSDFLPGPQAALAGGAPSASASLGFWDNRGDERSARRGQGRENTPRTDGDDSYDPDAENPNAQYSTPGPEATPPGESGLGTGVPGTDADSPAPPGWTPPPDGAGEYDSEIAGPIDHSAHSLAREAADIKRGDWPNASEHLDHFLDNPGEDDPADVDSMIQDQPGFATQAEDRRHQAGADAVARAQADGATGPVTYPLSTPWSDYTADGDWFYASGSFNHNQTGTVTAYPPDADHPDWRYEVDSQVNFRDRYNWDGGKQTQIGPFTVSDETLAALHRGGNAREYNLVGESSSQHTEGTVP